MLSHRLFRVTTVVTKRAVTLRDQNNFPDFYVMISSQYFPYCLRFHSLILGKLIVIAAGEPLNIHP